MYSRCNLSFPNILATAAPYFADFCWQKLLRFKLPIVVVTLQIAVMCLCQGWLNSVITNLECCLPCGICNIASCDLCGVFLKIHLSSFTCTACEGSQELIYSVQHITRVL